jgi:hypothetical protein
MEIIFPPELNNRKNKNVLAYLRPLSCHSDIVGPLDSILKTLKNVKSFCPDPVHFKFCFWYVNQTIFAFAVGMHNVALMIPPEFCIEAISEGAVACGKAGKDWYLFPYDHSNLNKWARLAFKNTINS